MDARATVAAWRKGATDDPDGIHVELSAELEQFWDDVAEYEPRVWAVSPRTTNLWASVKPDWR